MNKLCWWKWNGMDSELDRWEYHWKYCFVNSFCLFPFAYPYYPNSISYPFQDDGGLLPHLQQEEECYLVEEWIVIHILWWSVSQREKDQIREFDREGIAPSDDVFVECEVECVDTFFPDRIWSAWRICSLAEDYNEKELLLLNLLNLLQNEWLY